MEPKCTQTWDSAKAVLRHTYVRHTYIKKELSQINNLTVHIKKLEKERRNETQSWQKEIIKIRIEIEKIDKEN